LKNILHSDILNLTNILSKCPNYRLGYFILTTASNERFFSFMKRVKNYLRLTMGYERLSDFMVIAIEREKARFK